MAINWAVKYPQILDQIPLFRIAELSHPLHPCGCQTRTKKVGVDPLVLKGHAFEVAALELPAGDFRCLLVEAAKARPVERLVTFLHALGERVRRSKRGASLELRFT